MRQSDYSDPKESIDLSQQQNQLHSISQEDQQMQQSILEELNIIREKLEKKQRILNKKQSDLNTYEKQIQEREKDARIVLEQQYEHFVEEAQARFKQQFSTYQNKINQMEKKIKERFIEIKNQKLITQQSQGQQQKIQAQQMDQEKESINKLKTRISALENQNVRKKIFAAEQNGKADRVQVTKIQEQNQKLKQKNTQLEKLLSELQQQEAKGENQPKKINKQKKENKSEKKQSTEQQSLQNALYIIMECLGKTIPLYTTKTVSIGELLYPEFNTLVSVLVESLVTVSSETNSSLQYGIVGTLYKILAFVYFERETNYEEFKSNDHIEQVLQSFHNFKPYNIEMKPITEHWKKKLTSSNSGKPLLVPLIDLFSQTLAHKEMTSQLIKITEVKAHPKYQNNLLQVQISALLIVFLCTNQATKLRQALISLKEMFCWEGAGELCKEIMLNEIQYGVEIILSTFQHQDPESNKLITEIWLLLSICEGNLYGKLMSATQKYIPFLIDSLIKHKHKECTEVEDNLIIILQKCSENIKIAQLWKNANFKSYIFNKVQEYEQSLNSQSSFYLQNLQSLYANVGQFQ